MFGRNLGDEFGIFGPTELPLRKEVSLADCPICGRASLFLEESFEEPVCRNCGYSSEASRFET